MAASHGFGASTYSCEFGSARARMTRRAQSIAGQPRPGRLRWKAKQQKNGFRHREKSAKLGLLFQASSAPRLFSQPLLTEIGDARGQDVSMMTCLASTRCGQWSREAPRRWRDAGRVVICVVGDPGRRCCRPRSSGDLPITWRLAVRPGWRRSRNVSAHRHWGTIAGLGVKASPSSGPYSTPPAAACASRGL